MENLWMIWNVKIEKLFVQNSKKLFQLQENSQLQSLRFKKGSQLLHQKKGMRWIIAMQDLKESCLNIYRMHSIMSC